MQTLAKSNTNSAPDINWELWEPLFRSWLLEQEQADGAHDIQHIQRVVASSRELGRVENADFQVLIPAAWLHDCVTVPKSSSQRSKASLLAADRAIEFLAANDYPSRTFEHIHHAIVAHSFSARVTPETLEAKVLQDADRLDALGAIGLSRCLYVCAALERELYEAVDPFCRERAPDDSSYTLDHFLTKLLKLEHRMNTEAGREEAGKRSDFLRLYLKQLESELPLAGTGRAQLLIEC